MNERAVFGLEGGPVEEEGFLYDYYFWGFFCREEGEEGEENFVAVVAVVLYDVELVRRKLTGGYFNSLRGPRRR